MCVKAAGLFGLWHRRRFYKYGSFSLEMRLVNFRIYSACYVVRLCDIDRRYSIFDFKYSKTFCILENDEIQNIAEFIAILRERSKIELDRQGKDYDVSEKIRRLS